MFLLTTPVSGISGNISQPSCRGARAGSTAAHVPVLQSPDLYHTLALYHTFFAITERTFISIRLDMSFNERARDGQKERRGSGIAARRLKAEIEDVRESLVVLYDAVFRATSSSSLLHRCPLVTSAFDGAGVIL